MTPKEAIKAIKCNYPPERYSMLREALNMAIDALEKQNKEAEPVRRGHWIKNAERQGWRCSECGQDDVYAFTLNWDGSVDALQDYFCPHCGAKMDELFGKTEQLEGNK